MRISTDFSFPSITGFKNQKKMKNIMEKKHAVFVKKQEPVERTFLDFLPKQVSEIVLPEPLVEQPIEKLKEKSIEKPKQKKFRKLENGVSEEFNSNYNNWYMTQKFNIRPQLQKVDSKPWGLKDMIKVIKKINVE
jgi:hypothetical protein